MTDQIRRLTNNVHLAGALAELGTIREGVTSKGVPYVSFEGKIQCGPDKISTVPFRSFVKSKKTDGTDSKAYASIKKWLATATPMTKDPNNPTMCDMLGSITDNPFVASNGKFYASTNFSIQLIGDFKGYAADIDLEGYIYATPDETRGEEQNLTGRKRLRLISRDIFNNTLDISRIVIPEELANQMEPAGYVSGRTATFYVSLIPHVREAQVVAAGGIGKQRETGGGSYLEWTMTGASPVIDEDSNKALDRDAIKAALGIREAHLKEVEAAGYQGKGGVSQPATNRGGLGAQKTVVTSDDDFDSIPF